MSPAIEAILSLLRIAKEFLSEIELPSRDLFLDEVHLT
jgi:hypothetical protein